VYHPRDNVFDKAISFKFICQLLLSGRLSSEAQVIMVAAAADIKLLAIPRTVGLLVYLPQFPTFPATKYHDPNHNVTG